MMSLRRWLISRYDFTGIARLFFKSTKVELAAVIIVALLTGIFFLGFGFWQGDINVYDGSNAFLPSSFIHNFDLALGFLVALFIGSSAFRFWWFSMGRKSAVPIPWWLYIKKVYLLPWHFFTQKRYADCEKDEPRRIYIPWLAHIGTHAWLCSHAFYRHGIRETIAGRTGNQLVRTVCSVILPVWGCSSVQHTCCAAG